MGSQRRFFSLLAILIFIGLFMVACERPLGGTGDDAAPTAQVSEDVGGGTDSDSAVTTEEVGSEAVVTDTGDTPVNDSAADTATDAPAEEGNAAAADDSAEAGGGTGDADSSTDAANDAEQVAEESDAAADTIDDAANDAAAEETAAVTTTIPATHTVAAGENLFRIGLKYNLSWVDIANENNLANPHALSVGQVLKLPGASAAAPDPEPTPSPQTETTYIVKAGDNLYRIGLSYGISWVQIAEANGLDSPNMIIVGSELKIPVNTPGPAPQFTHVVQPGETLFLISLQYGVTWPAIAEANDLASPYVIYVGQTLEIPGSQ
jgi:LysM repeat protein